MALTQVLVQSFHGAPCVKNSSPPWNHSFSLSLQESIEQWQKEFNFKTGPGRNEEQERSLLELLEPLELRLRKSTCDLTHIHNNIRERKL